MPLGTTTAAGILAPEEVGPSVVQPLRLRSAALRTATVIETVHPLMRFPIVVSDAAAELVEESAFIPETDADVTELNIVPVAFKALPTVSNELVADSATNAQAAAMIGDGLVRQFARKIDLAFYGGTTTSVPTGAVSVYGLEYLAAAGTGAVVLSPGTFDSFDVFADAISQIESDTVEIVLRHS